MKAIYAIRHIDSDRCYVGSATKVTKRWHVHKHLLKQDKHHSQALQRAWNKYGEQAFEFKVLEPVSCSDDLLVEEQKWIDSLDSYKNGFNVCPKSHNTLGRKHTEAAKEKMRIARRKLSDTQEHEVCERYVAGEYSTVLAKAFGLSGARVICDILERRGVKRRPKGLHKSSGFTGRRHSAETKQKNGSLARCPTEGK